MLKYLEGFAQDPCFDTVPLATSSVKAGSVRKPAPFDRADSSEGGIRAAPPHFYGAA